MHGLGCLLVHLLFSLFKTIFFTHFEMILTVRENREGKQKLSIKLIKSKYYKHGMIIDIIVNCMENKHPHAQQIYIG